MDNDMFNDAIKSKWVSDRNNWCEDLIKYIDTTDMSIYFTEDKYHLKSRVLRGTRSRHPQQTQFYRYVTEVFHRIGCNGPEGYGSPEELVNAFEHIINKYYLTIPANSID